MEEYKDLIIALIAGSMGAFARIFSEKSKKKISVTRALFIYSASLVVSYGSFEGTRFWGGREIIGIISIIGGMVSVDIVTIIIDKVPMAITQVPQIFVELLKYKLGVRDTPGSTYGRYPSQGNREDRYPPDDPNRPDDPEEQEENQNTTNKNNNHDDL